MISIKREKKMRVVPFGGKKGTGGKIKVIVSRAWESEKRNRLVKEGTS